MTDEDISLVTDEIESSSTETETQESTISTTEGRPEGLPDEFWNGDSNEINTQALLDGYNREAKRALDLRKQISKGRPTPPESADQYSIEIAEDYLPYLGEDNEGIAVFKQLAHENGLSQDQVNNIVSRYLDNQIGGLIDQGIAPPMTQEQLEEQEVKYAEEYRKQEMEKLGDDGKRTFDSINARMAALLQKGSLTPDDIEVYKGMMNSAETVFLMDKILGTVSGVNHIPTTSTTPDGLLSKEQLDAMGGDPRMKSDPAFAAKRTRGYQELERRGLL